MSDIRKRLKTLEANAIADDEAMKYLFKLAQTNAKLLGQCIALNSLMVKKGFIQNVELERELKNLTESTNINSSKELPEVSSIQPAIGRTNESNNGHEGESVLRVQDEGTTESGESPA